MSPGTDAYVNSHIILSHATIAWYYGKLFKHFHFERFSRCLATCNASLAVQPAGLDSDIIFWFSDYNVVEVSCISVWEPFYFYCVCSTVVGYQKDKAPHPQHPLSAPLLYIMIETPHPPDNHSRSTSFIYVVEHLLLWLGFKDTTPTWYLPSEL